MGVGARSLVERGSGGMGEVLRGGERKGVRERGGEKNSGKWREVQGRGREGGERMRVQKHNDRRCPLIQQCVCNYKLRYPNKPNYSQRYCRAPPPHNGAAPGTNSQATKCYCDDMIFFFHV